MCFRAKMERNSSAQIHFEEKVDPELHLRICLVSV